MPQCCKSTWKRMEILPPDKNLVDLLWGSRAEAKVGQEYWWLWAALNACFSSSYISHHMRRCSLGNLVLAMILSGGKPCRFGHGESDQVRAHSLWSHSMSDSRIARVVRLPMYQARGLLEIGPQFALMNADDATSRGQGSAKA